ncbi:hypothetical protein T556_07545 [Neisseria gonorrhoeae NG-k51.05]|nr:hypothetical protein T556_07545 [Neisseria gonorrhoeae NG-k51.05]
MRHNGGSKNADYIVKRQRMLRRACLQSENDFKRKRQYVSDNTGKCATIASLMKIRYKGII